MRYISLFILITILASVYSFADTPPPGAVNIKGGTDNTKIGNVSDALKVNIVSGGGGGTVNQGNGGLSPWLMHFDNTTIGVTGTFWQATQPVSGPLTDTQLRATAVPVSGSLGRSWNLLNTTDSVNVGNFPSSFGVTQNTSPWIIALPTGASTSALQTTGNSSLSSIDGKIPSGLTVASTRLLTDGSGTTQPISVVSLPLPTGASTSALQTTANTSLSSIDSKLTSPLSTSRTWTLNSGTDSVAISGSITATNSANGNTGAAVPAQATQVGGSDGTNLRAFKVSSTGVLSVDGSATTQPVSGTVTSNQGGAPWSISLPTGASTSALQTTGNASLSSIDGKIPSSLTVTATRLLVDGSGVTQPVSASSLPLPTGASTSANQTTSNTSLASIDSKLTSPLAVSQSGTWNLNNISGTVSLPTGAASAANQTTANTSLASIDTKTPALGQALMAASSPVVIASNQSAIPVSQSGTWTTGRTWSLLNSTDSVNAVQSGTWNLTNISGTVSLPTGASTSALQTTANTSLSSIDSKLTSPLAVSQSGTWNLNNISGTVSLPTLAATSTKQSDGTQKTQVVDGAGAVYGPTTTLSAVNYLPVVLAASSTSGSAIPARSILISGSDGTNARNLSTDTSGNLNVNASSSTGRTSVNLTRNDYSTTNVTTAAYVQLIASTADTTNQIYIFDSSGQTLFLAVGAAGSEVNKAYIVPGGNGELNLNIPSGSRVSVKAITATASSGELSITLLK